MRQSSVRFNAERNFAKLRAKVLYVLPRTDKLLAPAIAPAVLENLRMARVEATYAGIDSDFCHLVSSRDTAKRAPALQAFPELLTSANPSSFLRIADGRGVGRLLRHVLRVQRRID